jgi:hypothetical protein
LTGGGKVTLTFITTVVNSTDRKVYLKSTDPSWQPSVTSALGTDGTLSGKWAAVLSENNWRTAPGDPAPGKFFAVGPRTILGLDKFCIPWPDLRNKYDDMDQTPNACVYLIVDEAKKFPVADGLLKNYGLLFQIARQGNYDLIQAYRRSNKALVVTLDGSLREWNDAIKVNFVAGWAAAGRITNFRLNITDDSIDFELIDSNADPGSRAEPNRKLFATTLARVAGAKTISLYP